MTNIYVYMFVCAREYSVRGRVISDGYIAGRQIEFTDVKY